MGIFGKKPDIEKLKEERNVEGLIEALKDEHSDVRSSAADALGKIGDARAVEPQVAEERPFIAYVKNTAMAFGLLIKAIVICFVFLGVGGGLAPLVFIGIILGMFPNIIPAVFSWVVTIPLLCALPFHAIYALVVVIAGKSPDYTKGIYGAVKWVEHNGLYNPTFRRHIK